GGDEPGISRFRVRCFASPRNDSIPPLTAAERLEGDDGAGVLDARNDLHLLVDEVADVGLLVDVELDQQVEVPSGGIDLRGNLGLGERIGHRVGLPELALDLDEEGDHRVVSEESLSYVSRFLPAYSRFGRPGHPPA